MGLIPASILSIMKSSARLPACPRADFNMYWLKKREYRVLQNDQIKVMINVIHRLVLSLLKVNSHTRPNIMVMSSRLATRLSKYDVLRQADSSDIVNSIW